MCVSAIHSLYPGLLLLVKGLQTIIGRLKFSQNARNHDCERMQLELMCIEEERCNINNHGYACFTILEFCGVVYKLEYEYTLPVKKKKESDLGAVVCSRAYSVFLYSGFKAC